MTCNIRLHEKFQFKSEVHWATNCHKKKTMYLPRACVVRLVHSFWKVTSEVLFFRSLKYNKVIVYRVQYTNSITCCFFHFLYRTSSSDHLHHHCLLPPSTSYIAIPPQTLSSSSSIAISLYQQLKSLNPHVPWSSQHLQLSSSSINPSGRPCDRNCETLVYGVDGLLH